MHNPTVKVDKIGVVDLFRVKKRGGAAYITIPLHVIESYEILPQDLLKVQIREVRRTEKGSGQSSELE